MLTAAVGCGDAPAEPAPASAPDAAPRERTGSLSFALTTLDGVEFDDFRYAITGPNFARAGTIDVRESAAVTTLVEGIPEGPGYAITLVGTSAAPRGTECSGSAAFAVAAGVVTEVPVSVACHFVDEPAPPGRAAVPLPPSAPAVFGLTLLALGVVAGRRSRE